jgi:hypothetical protein
MCATKASDFCVPPDYAFASKLLDVVPPESMLRVLTWDELLLLHLQNRYITFRTN